MHECLLAESDGVHKQILQAWQASEQFRRSASILFIWIAPWTPLQLTACKQISRSLPGNVLALLCACVRTHKRSPPSPPPACGRAAVKVEA